VISQNLNFISSTIKFLKKELSVMYKVQQKIARVILENKKKGLGG
jgi:hypothetical protein